MAKQLVSYNIQQHEALAVAWFFHLRQTGDLDRVFFKDNHTITAFLNWCGNYAKLAFKSDAKGICFAAWIRPILNAAEFGLWIREDKRQSPSSLRCLYEAFDEIFDHYPVIMGVSKQQHLRDIHEKFGYKFGANIPNAWDGHAIQVYYLTKEAYYERRTRNGSTGRVASNRRPTAQEVER